MLLFCEHLQYNYLYKFACILLHFNVINRPSHCHELPIWVFSYSCATIEINISGLYTLGNTYGI